MLVRRCIVKFHAVGAADRAAAGGTGRAPFTLRPAADIVPHEEESP
jgi:hypothetical protein